MLIPNIYDDWMDSTLWTMDASLQRHATLSLKIGMRLNFVGAGTASWTTGNGATTTQNHIDWDPHAKAWFRERMLYEVMEGSQRWHERYWLVPDRDWAGSFTVRSGAQVRRFAPAIQCRLILDLDADRPHAVVDVRRLPRTAGGWRPNGFLRSRMRLPGRFARGRGATRGWLDTGDVLPRGGAGTNTQIPVCHEMGHYIGTHHDGAPQAVAAGLSPNHASAYGPTNIMGSGTVFAPWNAFPWCKQLRRHLVGPAAASGAPGATWASVTPTTWDTMSGVMPGRTDVPRPAGLVRWTVVDRRPASLETHSKTLDVLGA